MSIFLQIADFMRELVATFGYPGIFFAMVIEGILTPIPSPVFLPFAGLLASEGVMILPLVILIGTAGATLGSLGAYSIGLWLGRPFLLRRGKLLGIGEDQLDVADRWFQRYGIWAIFLGNAMTGIRSIISFPAGLTRMPLKAFIPFTFLGALVWTTVLVTLGFFLGEAVFAFAESIESFDYLILGGLGIALLSFFIYRRWKKRKSSRASLDP